MAQPTTHEKHTAADEAEHRFEEASHSAKKGVREAGRSAKAAAYEQFDRISAEVQDIRRSLTHQIERKPINSVLIAAGAGVLVGFLLRRR